MKKILLTLIAASHLLFPAASSASEEGWTAYGGALTYHFNRDKAKDEKLNEANLMVGLDYKGYSAFYFNNSYRDDTVLLGKLWTSDTKTVEAGVGLGLMWGYEQDDVFLPCFGSACIAVPVFLRYTTYSWQPMVIWGGSFVSLAISKDF